MNNPTLYTEEDIKNIITKREMKSAKIEPIKSGDTSICFSVGTERVSKLTPMDFARYLFPDRKCKEVAIDDGGIFITFKEEEN